MASDVAASMFCTAGVFNDRGGASGPPHPSILRQLSDIRRDRSRREPAAALASHDDPLMMKRCDRHKSKRLQPRRPHKPRLARPPLSRRPPRERRTKKSPPNPCHYCWRASPFFARAHSNTRWAPRACCRSPPVWPCGTPKNENLWEHLQADSVLLVATIAYEIA
jgi:hypothetical protein